MKTPNLETIHRVMPHANVAWAIALLQAMPQHEINNERRIAGFLGQIAVESDGLTRFDESLYYTDAERVRRLFGKHFDALDCDDAWGYLNQPERFANRVYAGRYGNGDEASGDGWAFRGSGPLQVTFRDTFKRLAPLVGYDILVDPDAVRRVPLVGCRTACAYWQDSGLNELADAEQFHQITRRINAASLDLTARLSHTQDVLESLV